MYVTRCSEVQLMRKRLMPLMISCAIRDATGNGPWTDTIPYPYQ